jgi:hypothetical protein
MRSTVHVTIALGAGFVLLSLSPASATRCLYPERTVSGSVQRGLSQARASAIQAWEAAVARRSGKRFADWYYSGDRTFTCSWNTRGDRIRCQASAVPCGE